MGDNYLDPSKRVCTPDQAQALEPLMSLLPEQDTIGNASLTGGQGTTPPSSSSVSAASMDEQPEGYGVGDLTSDLVRGSKLKYGAINLATGNAAQPVMQGLAVLGGINTAVQHDPMNDGVAGYAEKAAMGTADTAWAMTAGPAAFVDNALGGNGSGLLRGGLGAGTAALSALAGNTDAADQYGNDVLDGKYGATAGVVGVAGDALAQAAHGLLTPGDQEYDLSAMEQLNDALQNGSNLNPITWASRFGNWLAE